MTYIRRLLGTGLILCGMVASAVIGGIGTVYYISKKEDKPLSETVKTIVDQIVYQLRSNQAPGAETYQPSECLSVWASVNRDSFLSSPQVQKYLQGTTYNDAEGIGGGYRCLILNNNSTFL